MYFRCFTLFFLSIDVLPSQSAASRRHHGVPWGIPSGLRAWTITGDSPGELSSTWAAEGTLDAPAKAAFMVIIPAENF